MEIVKGEYFYKNREVFPAENFSGFAINHGTVVYEVIRVINTIPVFLEDHLQRLQNSMQKSGSDLQINKKQLSERIQNLIKLNHLEFGNFKIVYHLKKTNTDSWIYFIPFKYPSEKNYSDGVSCGLLEAERNNPEVKSVLPSVRGKADLEIKNHHFFEVFLVNKEGCITEGSRSNVFFIKESQLFTPPVSEVLNGITRQKVIQIAQQLGIRVNEKNIPVNDLELFDSVFITGTSPKVLPVSLIGSMLFDANNLIIRRLLSEYDKLVANFIKQKMPPGE